jgi:carboxypeptidase family protein
VSRLAPPRFVRALAFASLSTISSGWASREPGPSREARATTVRDPEAGRSPAVSNDRSPARSVGLSGRVVDAHGDAISDAEVWLEDMDSDGADAGKRVWLGTDADGRFQAPRVRPALYTVTAAARGFRASAIAVELDAETTELSLELRQAPSPRAVVLDPDGRIVSNAVVVACTQYSEVTLRSATDGTVAFGPAAIGCSAVAHHARFARSSAVRLRGDGLAVLRLERGGSIEGVVTDPSGRALFDGEVSVTSYEPREDEQPLAGSLPELRIALGREFRLSGLAPGTYTLAVLHRARDEDSTTEELASASFEVFPGRVVRGAHIVAEQAQVVTLVSVSEGEDASVGVGEDGAGS